MKKIFQYLFILGVIGFFFACQPKESITEISSTVVPPQITALPTTLTYTKTIQNDTIIFTGQKVNPGFNASATYILQVDTTGNNFQNPLNLISDIQDTMFKFSVSAFNNLLLSRWSPYIATSLDFRIIATLDHSNAAATVPLIIYYSPTQTAKITLYGLPQLNLIGSGTVQNIQSAQSNNVFSGLVLLNTADPFTLQNPISGTVYGATGGNLVVKGSPIPCPTTTTPNGNGWYVLTVDTTLMTVSFTPNFVDIIGSFAASNWSTDIPMNYNPKKGFWYGNVTLAATDQFKFRLNDDWNGPPTSLNIGVPGPNGGSYANIENNGSSNNIGSPGAGTWYVTLTYSSLAATATVSCTMALQP